MFIADEEKKPSFKSNCVALHNASEKKPIGSHSVRDLNLLLNGHSTLVFSITFLYKAVRTHNVITEDVNEGCSLLLLAVIFLTADDVEFYLTNALWLDEVGKALILIPGVAVFLKFHCLPIEVGMLLV